MLNLFLGISLTLNFVLILFIILYLKYKVFGINKMKKDIEKMFINDDDYNDLIDRL